MTTKSAYRQWFDWAAATVLAFALAGMIGCIDAVAAMFLWAWFVVPLGVPPISYAHVFGLLCLVEVATLRMKSSDYSPTAGDLALRIVSPLLLLMAGYLFSQWKA